MGDGGAVSTLSRSKDGAKLLVAGAGCNYEELQHQHNNLLQLFSQTLNENKKLQQEVGALKQKAAAPLPRNVSEVSHTKQTIEREMIERLTCQLNLAEEKRARLKESCDNKDSVIELQKEKLEALTKDINDCNLEAEAAKRDLKETTERVSKELQELQEKMNHQEVEYEGQIHDLKLEYRRSQEKCAHLIAEKNGRSQKERQREDEIMVFRQTIDSQHEELTALREKLQETETTLKLSTASSGASILFEQQREREKFARQKKEMEENYFRLADELDESKQLVKKLQGDVQSLKLELREQRDRGDIADSNILSLTSQLEGIESELNLAIEERAALRSEIESLKEDKLSLEQLIDYLRSKNRAEESLEEDLADSGSGGTSFAEHVAMKRELVRVRALLSEVMEKAREGGFLKAVPAMSASGFVKPPSSPFDNARPQTAHSASPTQSSTLSPLPSLKNRPELNTKQQSIAKLDRLTPSVRRKSLAPPKFLPKGLNAKSKTSPAFAFGGPQTYKETPSDHGFSEAKRHMGPSHLVFHHQHGGRDERGETV